MKISTFNAFKSRNYRLYFTGQSISLIGTWMQKTAVSWVVYELTQSKWMLGFTLFATMFPAFIFSFISGVIADRYDRYKVLLFTQAAAMAQAILLTVLVFFKHYNVYEIIALGALLGIITAFDVPARQSLVYEMIDDKKELNNALALNSSMVNLSQLIGPAVAGFAIEKLGDVVCFGLNAVSFIAVIGSLLMMKLPKHVPKVRTKNIAGELKEGLAYIRKTPEILFILSTLGLISLFVFPFSMLIPVYAKDIFRGKASTFGIIDSAIGLGAFAGAIFLASIKPKRNLWTILVVNTFIFGTGLVLFSHTTYYPLALIFVTCGAFGMMSQMTISNTLIQTTVDPAMRGRVISFYAMAFFGMQPLGGLLVGFSSQHIGVENTVMAEGFIAILIGVLRLRFVRRNRKEKNVPEVKELELQPKEMASEMSDV